MRKVVAVSHNQYSVATRLGLRRVGAAYITVSRQTFRAAAELGDRGEPSCDPETSAEVGSPAAVGKTVLEG